MNLLTMSVEKSETHGRGAPWWCSIPMESINWKMSGFGNRLVELYNVKKKSVILLSVWYTGHIHDQLCSYSREIIYTMLYIYNDIYISPVSKPQYSKPHMCHRYLSVFILH